MAVLLPRIGREAILDAILAHVEEERQGKKSPSEIMVSRFTKLGYIFRSEKINGKKVPGNIDMYRISELISRGKMLREQREKKASLSIISSDNEKPDVPRDPVVAGKWLEQLLGRRARIAGGAAQSAVN